MGFIEKYATAKEKVEYDLKPDKDNAGFPKSFSKKIVSDDAYAVGEMIDNLIKKIEQVRIQMING